MTTPTRRAARGPMLLPKPTRRHRRQRPPAGHELAFLAASLAPPERRALREIVAEADILSVDGRLYLLAPVTPAAVDALAAFEAAAEDLEDDDEDRCAAHDDDPRIWLADSKAGEPEDAEDSDPAGAEYRRDPRDDALVVQARHRHAEKAAGCQRKRLALWLRQPAAQPGGAGPAISPEQLAMAAEELAARPLADGEALLLKPGSPHRLAGKLLLVK